MTDEELYHQCCEYGALALLYRRKFMGLLPEVNRRKLFKLKGFSSIFEFAFKLGGLNEEQVKRTLSLEERFEDRPLLQNLLTSGEVSVHKLARVAAVARPETEGFWAVQVQNLPNRALETLVRDSKNIVEVESVHVHNLKLTSEVENRLAQLQEKGIDVNALLLEFLEKREKEIAIEKETVSLKTSSSHHIPTAIRNVLKKEFGNKCAIPKCKKLAEQIHHTHRYSLAKNHDPHYLAPLCKEHHQIAHSIDQKVTKHFSPPLHTSSRPDI